MGLFKGIWSWIFKLLSLALLATVSEVVGNSKRGVIRRLVDISLQIFRQFREGIRGISFGQAA